MNATSGPDRPFSPRIPIAEPSGPYAFANINLWHQILRDTTKPKPTPQPLPSDMPFDGRQKEPMFEMSNLR